MVCAGAGDRQAQPVEPRGKSGRRSGKRAADPHENRFLVHHFVSAAEFDNTSVFNRSENLAYGLSACGCLNYCASVRLINIDLLLNLKLTGGTKDA